VLELDLIGRPVTLSEGDARWIYGHAKASSGHSLGARDLATRLQDLDPDQEPRRLVLTRTEASALARLLDAAAEPPPGCDELLANLVELLATSNPAPDPRLEGDAIA
jgi:hypothetical protein